MKPLKSDLKRILDNFFANIVGYYQVSPSTHLKPKKTLRMILNEPHEEILKLVEKAEQEARVSIMNEVFDRYNLMFEPNGEFRSFGSLKPKEIANFFTSLGEWLRSEENRLSELKND